MKYGRGKAMIFKCSNCGYSKEVPDKYAGKTVKCPKCKSAVKIGMEEKTAPTAGATEKKEPEIKTDISFKTFLGRGSGESIQMKFEGDGFVVIQPYEEVYFQSGS